MKNDVQCAAGRADPAVAADLVLLEGGELLEGVAVRDGRVVGTQVMGQFIGEKTHIIELGGRTVVPGLVDGHAHLYGLGASLENISLRGYDSEEKAAAAVAEAAKLRPGDDWLVGRGWDQNLWTPQEFPTKGSLDAVVANRPVAVRRVDGHALWANSKAIGIAGITRKTRDPVGGKILHDARGEPTGVFIDTAMDLVESKIPAPSPEVIERRILAAAAVAVEKGLTGVHEMGIGDATIAVYRKLATEGRLPLRVYAFLSYQAGVLETLPTRERILDEGGRFTLRAVKVYADGALGSRGAALLAPYSDDAKNSGHMITSAEEIAEVVKVAAAAGWQVGVHAIGDRANRVALDAFEKVIEADRMRNPRFRVEHAQVVAPEDLSRFGELGVIASMQPTHCTSDMPWAEERVGAERVKGAYAWRRVKDLGGHILGGSDFPIEGVSPLLGIYAAVTRQDVDGHPADGWYPDQRLTLFEAVQAFTYEPAYASFTEAERDRADLTVFDRPLAADRSLLETKVELTLVGGNVVFASPWAQQQMAAPASRVSLCPETR